MQLIFFLATLLLACCTLYKGGNHSRGNQSNETKSQKIDVMFALLFVCCLLFLLL